MEAVPELKRYKMAFRTSNKYTKGYTPQAVTAWLRIGERQALDSHCAPFDKDEFHKSLAAIRTMTHQSPDKFKEPLHNILAGAGVVLVLCPHMPGIGIHGATFWMGRDKAVIMMTLRYGWADIFWFSLFHELGHILLHGRNTVVLEGPIQNPKHQRQEAQANTFAGDNLIPPKLYQAFVCKKDFYEENIKAFADSIEIDPGIVVGRLQHDGLVRKDWHNSLRKRFVWIK